MTARDTLSAEFISDQLRLDCPEDITHLIDEALGLVKSKTGFNPSGSGERIEYIHDWPETITLKCDGRECDDIKWTLEVHSNGLWVPHNAAEKIGDVICVGSKCSCDCDCNACDGAPQLRLITWPACGEVPAYVSSFVRRYVAYHYMNRGDAPDMAAEKALMSSLSAHIPIAYC